MSAGLTPEPFSTPEWEDEENSGQEHTRRDKWRDVLIGAALMLATAVAYARVWNGAFLNFDDTLYVSDNPYLRNGFTGASLKWVLFSFYPDNWFPVTRLSHLIDYTLFGANPAWHHAMNVAIHAGASVLLFRFLTKAFCREPGFGTGRWAAAIIAFLFALHPLHVQSVAWISERKDVLCAFFWFAALSAWVDWVRRPSRTRYLTALSLFALGLMSKPMIVTFPLVLLVLDIWPLRRDRSVRTWVAEKLPFWGLALGCAVLTWRAQASTGAIQTLGTYSPAMRLENAFITPWIYIGKTILPWGLSPVYPWPVSFPVWQFLAGGAAIIATSFVAIRELRKRPWLAAGWFWFLATLAPVIGLIQVGQQVRADRYMYVPMVGLAMMAAGAAAEFLAWRPAFRRFATVIACLVLAVFAVRTSAETEGWRDSETLFRRAIAVDAFNHDAWFYLGNTLANIPGQQTEAIAAYRQAVGLRPNFVEAREKLARTLCSVDQCVEGLAEFERSLRERPAFAEGNFDMGNALVRTGRVADAIPRFRNAVRLNPGHVLARINLGAALKTVALESQGNGASERLPDALREAVTHLEEAVRLDPSNGLAHFNLGTTLAYFPERHAEAVIQLRDALDMAPNDATAHREIGKLLLRRPETAEEGDSHLRTAQRLGGGEINPSIP